jgi:hypothetical protein
MASRGLRLIIGAALLLSAMLVSGIAIAQIMHRFGQSIQPVFEGFEQNPDGSYTMWFGYLNRNYEETPDIPLGEANFFQAADGVTSAGPVAENLILPEPGAIDREQPTYFYPRRQQFVFAVQVPSDFVGKELIWTLSYRGETNTAVGTLEKQNIWSVDEGVWSANRGRGIGGRTDIQYTNQPPAVRMVGVEGQLVTTVGQALTLRSFASDDGLPGPRTGRRSRELPPLPNALPEIGGRVGDNSPKTQSVVNFTAADETGLAVSWIKYRGPGQVEFGSRVTALNPSGEEALTSVQFSESGTYVLRVYADDGNYTRSTYVTVVVR